VTREELDPRVEVNGETVLAFLAGLVQAFGEIGGRIGDGALERIGRVIPDSARWPSDIEGIQDALASIDAAYHLNHRIGTRVLFDATTGELLEGIGHYAVDEAGPGSALVCCDDPYPCAFDLGIIRAVAERFGPEGRRVDVVHLEPGCRKSGGGACRYRVTW
jgi:hypothetical protein